MDFHRLTRRELQALCKKNQIPANQTNVAMADALHALSNVEGIEELSQPEGFQTPAPCRMSQRTSRKKSELPPDAVVIELEDSAAPVSRVTRRGTAARASSSRRRVTSEEEGETTEVVALEALQSPLPTRSAGARRATAGKSTRRASDVQHDVVKPVGTESNLKMSVRRSARFKSVVDQAVQVLPSAVTKSRRKKMAVKIGALNEEPEESRENMAGLLVDTVETADFTNVEGALESEDKAGLFPASNDLTFEATEKMTRSEDSKSEVVDEKELTDDFKSEPLLLAEVMPPTNESKLDVVDTTSTALLEKETESVRRSARIMSVNKAVDEFLSVAKSRSKKMDVKIGALTAEPADFTDNMPGNMSARRSARIKSANKAVEECPSVTKSTSKKMAVKIGALTIEKEDFTDNMPEETVDTGHTANDTNMEVPFVSVGKAGFYSRSKDLQNDVDNTNIALLEEETKTVNQESHFLGEVVALSEESKFEVADEEETDDFEREPLPSSEVMMPSSEEIKNDVALLEEEAKTVNQESHFLGDMDEEDSNTQLPLEDGEEIKSDVVGNTNIVLLEEEAKTMNQESHFLGDMDEEDSNTQLPLEDGEEIKSDVVGNTNIAQLEEEPESVNQESFLGDMDEEENPMQLPNAYNVLEDALLEEEAESVNQESFLGDMDEEDNPRQLPNASNVLEDALLEEEAESVNQESFLGDMDEEDNPMQLPKAVNKDFMGSIGNFSIDDSATSEKTVSLLNEMELTGQEELKSLNPTLADTTIEEYEQIAGLAADVSVKDTNLFVGDVPVEAVGEELAVNINNIEWSFFMGGCGDFALRSPDATPSVLTAKEHDILASNRVSESPFLLNILYEEEPSEKESERIFIEGTGKTPKKENLNANSKTPILFDTAEMEAMLVAGTVKKTPGKETVKKNSNANSVSKTPYLFNTVTEEILLEGGGTEKKTPKKTGATPAESKKTQEDADKENNGVKKPLQLVKEKSSMYQDLSLRQLKVLYKENASEVNTPKKTGATTPGESKKTQEDADKENNGVKKPLQLVKEKSSMYQDLSLRQLKVLYKKKASEVKKAPALQPLNQNCSLGDGNM